MQTRAPKGQYRVIGLNPVDTLSWPSGRLWKDCESLMKHETALTAKESCTPGSTSTTTAASFFTREAATGSSLKD